MMGIKHVLRRSDALRLWLAGAVLGLSLTAPAAWAARASDFGKNAVSSTGKTTTIYPMGAVNATGSTIPVSPSIGGWTAAGNYGFPTGPTGPTIGVNYKGQFADGNSPTGQAMKYPYTAKSSVSKEDIAKAIGTMGCSVISGGVAALACMAAVPLIADWFRTAGVTLNPETGAPGVPSSGGTQSTGNEYRFARDDFDSGWWPTREKACSSLSGFARSKDPGFTMVYDPVWRSCGVYWNGSPLLGLNGADRPSTCPAGTYTQANGTCTQTPGGGTTPLPSSMDDIAPYLTARDPDGGVIGEILSNGGTIPLGVPTITGPTSIKGPETTTTNADGSRTVTSTTNNYTTSGNTVTNVSNVTTTTTYNTDNSVRNTTTTTTVPTEETEKEDVCKENPERLGCVEIDTPEGKVPKETKTITFAAEDVLGTGQCPANATLNLGTLGGQHVTVVDWQTFCGYALPLRAMVMALAAIMAFFIILPGGGRLE